MGENQPLQDLSEVVESVFLLQPTTLSNVTLTNALECFTIDEFHNQQGFVRFFNHIEYLDDILMTAQLHGTPSFFQQSVFLVFLQVYQSLQYPAGCRSGPISTPPNAKRIQI